MARDVSIMISAKDNYTTAIQKMQRTQTSFRKDLGQLNKELTQLNNNKTTLKVDFAKAKTELAAAEKAFKATGDEASRLQMEAAQANYENIRSNLELVSKAAKQTERDMQTLTGTFSKTENRAAGTSGTLSTLAKAGLTGMLGNALSGASGAVLTSAFGSETGNSVMSILSGAATGAAMGSIAGPAGTAIGGLVGAATGLIQAATQSFTNRDEAYKSGVQTLYEDAISGRAEQIESGSSVAGTREQRQIAFGTLLGSDAAATEFLASMRQFAQATPFGEDQLATMSKTLLAYNYQVDELLPLLTAIGDTGSALGMNSDDMVNVATYLGRMNTTGKTTLEYLNPLLERGIPVFDYLAQATGKTNKQVQEMVSKGLIPGQDAAKIIADYMGGNFAGNMEKQSETYLGLVSTLEDVQANMDAAMGAGYNEERKKGIEAEIAYYEGAGGDRMQEANRLIGAYEASLENLQEQKTREAMDAAWQQIDAQGITDAAEQGRILQEAKAKAAIEYTQTEEYQNQVAQQQTLIDNIQTAMEPEYYMAGYTLGQKLSEGIIDGAGSLQGAFGLNPYSEIQNPNGYERTYGKTLRPRAFGQMIIPYDNYPILAHEGEQLLTAGQSRRGDGSGVSVTVKDNNFVVREDADIGKIASAIADELYIRKAGYVG